MKIVRETKTMCPECRRELDGAIVQEGDNVSLRRHCPEHGFYQFPLSKNGGMYADFDRFYFEVLRGREPVGKITNIWVCSCVECQMMCKYCSHDISNPAFEQMTWADLERVLDQFPDDKLTLSGGEPTLHPNILDFFKEATKRGMTTQLATNGVRLADKEFCKELAEAGLKEVRLSLESLNRDQTASLHSEPFYEAKLRAIENLLELGITTSLSPTVFTGINDDQLVACIEFAKDKPQIRSISVNGFSWVGGGRSMDRENMTMPDALMDLLCERYFPGRREEGYTFQKALLTVMQLVGIRVCFYTQIMVFVRTRRGVVPITDFLNMKRLKKGMTWWESFSRSGKWPQIAAITLVLGKAARLKSLTLVPVAVSLFFANFFKIKISKYPSALLPVTINTNCSPLSMDEAVQFRCMSKFVRVVNGEQDVGLGTYGLLDIDKNRSENQLRRP